MMMRSITRLACLAAVGLLLACAKKADDKTIKPFTLTIAIATPLDESPGTLPQSLAEFWLPIEPADCLNMAFDPNVSIVRLDLEKIEPLNLALPKDSGWVESVQRFLGKKPLLSQIRSSRSKALVKERLDPRLTAKTGSSTSLADYNLRQLLDASEGGLIFTVGSSRTNAKIALKEGHQFVAHQLTEIVPLIGQQLCSATEKGEEPPSCIVILEASDPPPPPLMPVLRPPQPPKVEPPQEQLATEKTLSGLERKNEAASRISIEKEKKESLHEVGEEIEHEGERHGQDYRYPYLLMKNRVYGKEHLEAFRLLRQAAEIAIDTGQADFLLDRMKGDLALDQHEHVGVWKLATGHTEWEVVMEALESKDKGMLSAVGVGSVHHHKD